MFGKKKMKKKMVRQEKNNSTVIITALTEMTSWQLAVAGVTEVTDASLTHVTHTQTEVLLPPLQTTIRDEARVPAASQSTRGRMI